jgi:hypothetical protein
MEPGREDCGAAASGARRRAAVHALALAAVFAAELALFWAATGRHAAWVYPRWFDQVQYLREAYDAGDRMRAGGFAAGAQDALAHVSPQGSLHGFFALLVFAVAGPSRLSALGVNLVAFVVLQAVTFLAVRRISGSYALAWAAVGLLAALQGPWSGGPGSAADFRLDWMAACAYGAALGVAVAGSGFRSVRWALLLGAAVGVVLLTRYLCAVYFAIIYAALFFWLLARPGRWRRCGCLALSGVVAAGIAAVPFWRARAVIYSYYWVGHFAGPEAALRNSHMGGWSSARWMASELLFAQVGPAAAILGAGAAAAFLAASLLNARGGGAPSGPARPSGDAWAVAVAFFAAPVAVLGVHPDKVSQPLAVIVPAAAWIIILAWLHLGRRAGRGAVAATCSAVAVAGAVLFVKAQERNPLRDGMDAEFREVNALGDYLFFRSEESGLSRPRIAVTWWLDSLNAGSFETLGRERHGRWLHFTGILPTGLFPAAPAVVMERLAAADFVCLVTRAPQEWPFDRQMAAMLPEMSAWCAANLRQVGALDTAEFSATVYERPALARPPAGTGVNLPAMLGASLRGPANAPAEPPFAPLAMGSPGVLATTRAELRYAVKAAYSPMKFRAIDLPDGVSIDPESGEIRGWLRRPGIFTASVSASNARGSSGVPVVFQVVDAVWDARIDAPETATVGVPIDIGFEEVDGAGLIDFIDITDLTEVKGLGRLAANEDEGRNWQGACPVTFHEPGPHRLQLRFVRYDPATPEHYSFVDRSCTVRVAP